MTSGRIVEGAVKSPVVKPRALRPRDAASLIILDCSGARPAVLMGRRHHKAVFLPGTYVFPGGRVEREDRFADLAAGLTARDLALLHVADARPPSEARAQGFAIAALRESFEEAGVLIGGGAIPSTATWRSRLQNGFKPDLSALRFFARAITPPGRPRRYDTRLFVVDAGAVTAWHPVTDGELEDVRFVALDRVGEHPLPSITKLVLTDLEAWIDRGLQKRETPEVPFYRTVRGRSVRGNLAEPTGSA